MTNTIRLGDVATYINGYAFKPEDRGTEGLPIIRIQDLTGNAYDLGFYTGEYPEKIEINNGDVLISWSASLGVYIWDKGKALLNQHIFKVVFDKMEIDKQFFVYAVRHKLREMESKTHGATMKHIVKKEFANTTIPYPNMDIQREIANRIAKVENVIKKKKQEIRLLDDLIKSRFVEMFGNPVSNPLGWEKKPLVVKCDIITGNTPSRKVPEYYGDYIEWIKSDNINTPNAILTTAEEYLSEEGFKIGRSVDAGSILMTCIAGSIGCIGNVAIANRKVSFNQQINGIIPKENNTWFMYILFELSKCAIQSTINMALKGILSKGQLAEMEFIFPPVGIQNEFGYFAERVEKLKATTQKSIVEFQILLDSLLQKYFG